METSLEHADERDLIETFVERSRWHCRAARETFSADEFRPVTTVLALRNIGPGHAGSVELDIRRPDHLGPLVGLVDDELAERAGTHRHRLAAKLYQLRLDFQIGKRGIDLPVELVDDFGRRAFG